MSKLDIVNLHTVLIGEGHRFLQGGWAADGTNNNEEMHENKVGGNVLATSGKTPNKLLARKPDNIQRVLVSNAESLEHKKKNKCTPMQNMVQL